MQLVGTCVCLTGCVKGVGLFDQSPETLQSPECEMKRRPGDE